MDHPLDRPFWSALTSRQAYLAEGDAWAWRLPADIAAFAAAADASARSTEALAALAAPGGVISMVEAGPMPLPHKTTIFPFSGIDGTSEIGGTVRHSCTVMIAPRRRIKIACF